MTAHPTPPPREGFGLAIHDIQWLSAPNCTILVTATGDALGRKATRFHVWLMTDTTFYAVEDRGEDAEHPRFIEADPGWRPYLQQALSSSLEQEVTHGHAESGPRPDPAS